MIKKILNNMKGKTKLTKEDLFKYIKRYIKKNGIGPTRRDLFFKLDIGYSTLNNYLKWLKDDGQVTSVGFPKRYCILKDE